MVEHCRHGPLPVGRHWDVRVLEHSALSGSFEEDDIIASLDQIEGHGEQLFDVAVEPAEHHDRTLCFGRGEPIGGQRTALVGNARDVILGETVHLQHRADEPLARGRAAWPGRPGT